MISIIAAIGKNRELGRHNKLLWNIPEDMRRFRTLTTGHVVIMGRKTYESIGKPLPNRTNIVVSHQAPSDRTDAVWVRSLEEALERARKISPDGELFIIGGAQIYGEMIDTAECVYLTVVGHEYPEADTFFPEYEKRFPLIESKLEFESDGLPVTFLTLRTQPASV